MFVNPRHSVLFHKQGFVCFPILNKDTVDRATGIFKEFESAHHQSSDKFRGTGWIENEDVVNQINERTATLITPVFQEHFKQFQVLGFNFLLKQSGDDSKLPLHQDWTYVDEDCFYSMNIWMALEDTTIENGCLFMIPGSHKLGKNLRPSPSYPIPFAAISSFIERFKKPIELKAGECVCFNNKTIHGSYANRGNTLRLALVSTLYPTEANLLHHYVQDTKRPESITEYEIEKSTFLNIKRGEAPKAFISSKPVSTSYPLVSRLDFLKQWLKSFSFSS